MMAHSVCDPWHQSLEALLHGFVDHDIPPCSIEFVTTDSRLVRKGTLFLATMGIQRHGLEFVEQAWANGAVAVVYEPRRGVSEPNMPHGRVCIPIHNLTHYLGEIASRFFGEPSKAMTICGITGTNGKTTVTHLISHALRCVGKRCGQMGTLGFGLNDPLTKSSLTTPDAVSLQQRLAWIREQRASHLAMEVSSHAIDQHRVGAVTFDCAVFTNLSRDHLDYHGDMQNYAATKQRLFSEFPITHAVINADDAFGVQLIDDVKEQIPVTTISTRQHNISGVNNHLFAREIQAAPHGLRLSFDGSFGRGTIDSPLLGKFNAYNILSALAVLLHWGIELDQAAASLSSVTPPLGRMESFGREGEALFVVDYAHTPDALKNAVGALRDHCAGQLWCIFGCGGDRDRGKRPQMALATKGSDHVVVTNDNPRHEDPQAIIAEILDGFDAETRSCVEVEPDRKRAIESVFHRAGPGDVVLVAGKGHEDYQIIDNQHLALSDRDIVIALLKDQHNV